MRHQSGNSIGQFDLAGIVQPSDASVVEQPSASNQLNFNYMSNERVRLQTQQSCRTTAFNKIKTRDGRRRMISKYNSGSGPAIATHPHYSSNVRTDMGGTS